LSAATAPNREQIAEWNGEQGRRWVEFQRQLDRMIEPFGHAALQAAAPRPGERVLDIGCGCGSTTLALARAVGPQGRVLGVDISQTMLDAARRLAASHADLPLQFVQADASDAARPGAHDLLYSRFGLMFFDQPAAALRHLRGALRPGGRCAFVCWRAPRDNPWAMAPLVAARRALGINPPPADPLAPGPFAFADDQRLRELLAQAGFERIEVQRCDAAIDLGPSARDAAAYSLRIGPVSRLAHEAGPSHEPTLRAAVEQALATYAAADGSVSLPGSTWVVRAASPD
jgi:ubiquinone/menaquinone biosynthesis C-methylase UbiE